MCSKSIDDIRRSFNKTKVDEVTYPGVEEEVQVDDKKEKNKNIDEIHKFVDKL